MRHRAHQNACSPILWPLGLTAVLLAGCGPAPVPSDQDPESTVDAETVFIPPTYHMDESMARPDTFTEPIEEEGEPRPVGSLQIGDGKATELVLYELLVTVMDPNEIDAIIARWNAAILDVAEPDEFDDPGAPYDFLIRIDPDQVDTSKLAEHMAIVEPALSGAVIGSEAVMKTLAAAAEETAVYGTPVGLNWLTTGDAISEGISMESPDLGQPNAFQWSFMRSLSNQDIGVDVAWQMLASEVLLVNKVRIMIADGGFKSNPDFPDESKLRNGDWGDSNALDCGDNPCPWHASQVTLAAMAKIDNGYGTAGPAGPVGELIGVAINKDFWKRLRRIKKMVKEEHPHVVNMSFSTTIEVFRGASLDAANRHFKNMKNRGALLFASAGNDGIDVDSENCIGNNCYEGKLILPCESNYVHCVGGMDSNSTWKAPGSNYGSGSGSGSVEIYGPFCVVGMEAPDNAYSNTDVKTVCGTSFASPFVAGVAALVKAAAPSLGPDEIWQILRDTAHDGGVMVPLVVGDEASQLRINAYDAVREAMGLNYSLPDVQITAPANGSDYPLDNWLVLKGSAETFYGYDLPITWTSSIDGELSNGAEFGDIYLSPLSVGTHTITAEATDLRGGTGTDQITITIEDTPPVVTILAPEDGEEFYEGQSVDLSAFTKDPDTYGPLEDDAVFWTVRRLNNQAVFYGGGHVDEIPINTLTPGMYNITLEGGDENNVSEDVVTITVNAIPPNETVPTANILQPAMDIEVVAYNGTPQLIQFQGVGSDPEDGNLSPDNYRWTAVSENGTKIVLCEGSSFGEFDPEEYAGHEACDQFSRNMTLDEGSVGYTIWTVTLEVEDSSGLIGKDKVNVEIQFTTG